MVPTPIKTLAKQILCFNKRLTLATSQQTC
jgi:hypothetical protein